MAGFELSKSKASGDFTSRVSMCYIAAASGNIALGDVVDLTGTADSNGVKAVDVQASAAVTSRCYGVVVGIKPDLATESLSSVGIASGASGYVFVDDNPDTLYEVECDTTAVVGDVGRNVGYVGTAATVSGNIYTSNMEADGSSINTTVTLPFRIEGLLKGATSDTLGDRLLVRKNATFDADGAAGL